MATSLPYDPVASALEAVSAHILTLLPTAISIRGPEEFPGDYAGGLVFSIVELSREWEEVTPTEVSRLTIAQTNSTLYKVAQLRLRAQVKMWTDYRFIQDVIGGAVESGGLTLESMWHNRLPWKGGLELVSEWYHQRPLTITAGAGISEQDPDNVGDGMWRRIWDLDILTDLVARDLNSPIAETIIFELSTELGPDTVTEPDFPVPAP